MLWESDDKVSWYIGHWWCGCIQVERAPEIIPDRCPQHDVILIDGKNEMDHLPIHGQGYHTKNTIGLWAHEERS